MIMKNKAFYIFWSIVLIFKQLLQRSNVMTFVERELVHEKFLYSFMYFPE